MGQWLYSLITDTLTATLQIAKRVYALAQEQNDSALLMGAYRALAGTLYYLGNFESARQYSMRAIQIWRSGSVQSHPEDLETPIVTCLCYEAWSEWHLGEISSSKAIIAEAISVAKKLNDMHILAAALHSAAILGIAERDPAKVLCLATDLIELSTRHNFVYWLAYGSIHRGWARSALGETAEGVALIEQGIRDLRASGLALDCHHCSHSRLKLCIFRNVPPKH
jgi:hypothetical protein